MLQGGCLHDLFPIHTCKPDEQDGDRRQTLRDYIGGIIASDPVGEHREKGV